MAVGNDVPNYVNPTRVNANVVGARFNAFAQKDETKKVVSISMMVLSLGSGVAKGLGFQALAKRGWSCVSGLRQMRIFFGMRNFCETLKQGFESSANLSVLLANTKDLMGLFGPTILKLQELGGVARDVGKMFSDAKFIGLASELCSLISIKDTYKSQFSVKPTLFSVDLLKRTIDVGIAVLAAQQTSKTDEENKNLELIDYLTMVSATLGLVKFSLQS